MRVRLPRVLIVDDHPAMLDQIKSLLERDFEIVGTITDALTLYEFIDRLCPDLLVLDIGLPDLNGIDVLRRLKETGYPCKVVLVTAHGDRDYWREAIALGASGYVLKHRMASDLVGTLRKALAGETAGLPLSSDAP